MKTKLKTGKILTTLFAAGLLMTSCEKYEDGPAISLTPRKERVANTWIISYALEDGENVSSQYDQYELYLTADGDAQLDASYTSFGITYSAASDGTWIFSNDEKNIKFDFEDDAQDGEYEILRLSSNELWLKDISQNLELHLLEK